MKNISFGIVRAAAWEDWRWLLLHRGGWASQRRSSHQCHYKHLPAWPTTNAVAFHQPQPTQGHRVNARNRWRLGGEKGRGENQKRGRGILRIERGNFVRNNH